MLSALPTWTAEASIYPVRRSYQARSDTVTSISGSAGAPESFLQDGQELPVTIGSGERCAPHCVPGTCVPDPTFPTGCSCDYVTASCEEITAPCRGCTCPTGQAMCSRGVCHDITSNPSNCGACGHACAGPPDSTVTCANGTCGWQCNSGFVRCGSVCSDLLDVNNCGGCGNVCPQGPANSTPICEQTVIGNLCGWQCNSRFTRCGDSCCAPDEPCSTDEGTLATGLTECCYQATTVASVHYCCKYDPDLAKVVCHCISCPPGMPDLAPPGQFDRVNCACPCGAGDTNCGGACTDLMRDPQNCGGCGVIVPTEPPGQYGCCNGTPTDLWHDNLNCGDCEGPPCIAPAQCCPPGACADVTKDNANCGGCGIDCRTEIPGSSCVNGTCACPPGMTNCPPDGCTDLLTNDKHCGDCSIVCKPPRHCQNGECHCPPYPPWKDCSGTCRNVMTDPLNCGDCNIQCADGEQCVDGKCVCNTATSASCDALAKTCCNTGVSGVCVDLMTDPNHCRTCGHSCHYDILVLWEDVAVVRSAMGECVGGYCKCPTGWQPHGTSAGVDQQCCPPQTQWCADVSMCVNTNNCDSACGSCDNSCSGGKRCMSGKCVCPTGLTDCGGTCVDLMTNPQHCGSCPNACTGGTQCVKGQCLCTGNTPDNCSGVCTNKLSDRSNCGSCGNECNFTSGDYPGGWGSCVDGRCFCPREYHACDWSDTLGVMHCCPDGKECTSNALYCY
jgi:hypothetical protein